MSQPDRGVRFCQRCGAGLSRKVVEGQSRPYCESCGTIVYLDPKLAAVVLTEVDGKLVMVKRGVEPEMGRWAFPAGHVDRGESVESAARREVEEETGLVVAITELLGVYSIDGREVVLVAYAAEVVGGSLSAGHDAQEVGLFSPEELTDLPFPLDNDILKDWLFLEGRTEGAFRP